MEFSNDNNPPTQLPHLLSWAPESIINCQASEAMNQQQKSAIPNRAEENGEAYLAELVDGRPILMPDSTSKS
jgi:hypothetical protein